MTIITDSHIGYGLAHNVAVTYVTHKKTRNENAKIFISASLLLGLYTYKDVFIDLQIFLAETSTKLSNIISLSVFLSPLRLHSIEVIAKNVGNMANF